MNPQKLNLIEEDIYLYESCDEKTIVRFERNKSSLWILGIIVKKQYRRQGIGKRLIKEIFDYCNKENIRYLNWGIMTYAGHKYLLPTILSIKRDFANIQSDL